MSAFDVTIALLLSFLQGIPSSSSTAGIERLAGREYTEIPSGLCSGSAEVLVGEFSGHEYVGLICDRPVHSYIVLQQLRGYTDNKKAILKAVDIQPLPVMNVGEFSTNRGCVGNSQLSSQALLGIVAIVRDVGKANYQTIKAWRANLQIEKFEEINPQIVVCSRPWL